MEGETEVEGNRAELFARRRFALGEIDLVDSGLARTPHSRVVVIRGLAVDREGRRSRGAEVVDEPAG